MDRDYRIDIINALDISDWTTAKDIIEEIREKYALRITSRTWRSWVALYNEDYINGESKRFIASSNRGYCRTRRKDLCRDTEKFLLSTAFGMLKEAYALRRARGESLNTKLNLVFKETKNGVDISDSWK